MRDAEDPLLPLNYYDNDDGYWDEYIAEKEARWGKQPLITNRVWLKH